jgi:hypothetical protein
MQLAPSHIHGIDPPRTACQQDFGKAASRGADIEADAAARIKPGIEPEVIERRRELHSPSRHVRVRRLGAQDRIGGNFLRRLRDHHFVRRDAARGNGALRLGAALEQAAFDEQPVDADTASHENDAISGRNERHGGATEPHSPNGTNNDAWLLFPAGSL